MLFAFAFVDTNRYLCIVRNPENTKKQIISSASILFNTKGYKATSISDITKKAGLTKGAIYKHFKDKSDLEKECLISMTGILFSDITKNIKKRKDAPSKLFSILEYFEQYGKNPPFEGGCPLLNAAVEADDGDPELKKVVCKIVIGLQLGIAKVIRNGIERNQIKNNFEVDEFASVMYSAIEGAVMMLKVTDNDDHLQSVIKFLKRDIENKTLNA